MLKRKRYHTGKQCRESLRKNNQWESEKQTLHYKSPGRRQSRMLNSWSPHSPQAGDQRNLQERENSLHHIPRRPESIWQSVAGRNYLHPTQKWNRREKPQDDQETKLKPNSKNTDPLWPDKKNKYQRQHQTRRRPISHRVCSVNRWDIEGTKKERTRPKNVWKLKYRLSSMDGRCMPNPPWPGNTTRNAWHDQPCSTEVPHTIRSSKMQSNKKRKRKKK